MDILALLQCLHPTLSLTTIRQFSRILFALLALSGRVTMLNLSRWADSGGSYRTVQRWFTTALPWAELFWLFFRHQLFHAQHEYILAGDEVVVTKAGKHTFGLDRFFSSLFQKAVPGLAFFVFALVSVNEPHAFPLRVEQVVRSDVEKAQARARTAAQKKKVPTVSRKPGRPKGTPNRTQPKELSPELQRLEKMLAAQVALFTGWLSVKYVALDGHFGHSQVVQLVRRCGLHLVSKLRCDSALYEPYTGPQPKRGAHRKYGAKLNYQQLPATWCKQVTCAEGIETQIYQATLWHKDFRQALNVVLLVKCNLQSHACAHVILFSSDLTLAWDKVIEYYHLRFQIEFNFRDAKQYWGLEDFMNVTQTAVTNAASLSLFMVNVAYRVQRTLCPPEAAFSVLDLKAYARGYKYVCETIKMLQEKPKPNLISQIFQSVTRLGSIHNNPAVVNPL
jgi:putative transposase